MRIFGKSFSEYARLEKGVLLLIALVALARLGASLAGADSVAKWLSVTVALMLATIYVAIRVHTSGFGSYKQLLVLIWIQTVLSQVIIAGSITLSILTSKNNIYTVPEYSGNADGKNWIHVAAHLIAGLVVFPIVLWIIGSLVLLVTRKVSPRGTGTAAAAGA